MYRRWPGPAERTLVLLHGLASNGTRWREFAERARLDCDWQIISPDLRGHGGSVYRGRLRRGDWIRDVLALLDHCGCRQAVIGGHCLGANLALRLALEQPQRVRGLVLVEPMLPPALLGGLRHLRPWRWLLPLLALPVRMVNALGLYRRQLPRLDLTQLDQATRAAIADQGDPRAILQRYAQPGKDLAYMPTATYLQALFQLLRGLGSLEQIQVPVLALLSAGALLADPAITRALLQTLPDGQVEQLDALHWIPTEHPEAMARLIIEFLQALP